MSGPRVAHGPLVAAACLLAFGATPVSGDPLREAVERLLGGPGCHFHLDSALTLGSGQVQELHAAGVCRSETTYRYAATFGEGTAAREFRVLRIAGRLWTWEGEAAGWRARGPEDRRPPDLVESLLRMLGGLEASQPPRSGVFDGAPTVAHAFRVPVGTLRLHRMPVEGEGVLHVELGALRPCGVALSLRTADGGRATVAVHFSDYGQDVAVTPPGLGASPDELPPPVITAESLGEACALLPHVRVVARVEAEGLGGAAPQALPAELEVTAMPLRQTAVACFRAAGAVTDEVIAVGTTRLTRTFGAAWVARDEDSASERPVWQAHRNLLSEVLHERKLNAPERALVDGGVMWAYRFDPTAPTASGLLLPKALALAARDEREATGRLLLRREDGLPSFIELSLVAWPAGGKLLRVRETYSFAYGPGAEGDPAVAALAAWGQSEAARRAQVATDLRDAAIRYADRLSSAPMRAARVQPLLEEALAAGSVARARALGADGAPIAEAGGARTAPADPTPWHGTDEATVSWAGPTALCVAPVRRAGRLLGFLVLESAEFVLSPAPHDEESPPAAAN